MSEPPDSTRSKTKREARGRAKTGGSERRDARAKTVVPTLNEETAAALTLYNTYLIADREQQAHERALRKAEKAKDDAAAAVRKLNDRKAPASETAAAETTYRDAVAALQRLRDGDTAALKDHDDTAGDDTAGDDTTGDDTAGDDAEATLGGDVPTTEDTGDAAASDRDTATKDTPTDEPQTASEESTDEPQTASEESTDETQTASEESTDEPQTASEESTDETSSVGVEASVGDDDLAGDEPAGVAG